MTLDTCRAAEAPYKARGSATAMRAVIGAAAATTALCMAGSLHAEDGGVSGDREGRRADAGLSPASLPLQTPTVPSLPVTQPAAPIDDERRPFSTRHAYFSPAEWSELPGWQEDDLTDAWRAFLQSCKALGKKRAWEALCGHAANNDPDKGAARRFFEREFVLYEIRNADRTPDGVITGYYEPLLSGSRVRQGIYLYPVYGVPADLLTLDVRLWPKSMREQKVRARVEGRQVIPMPGMTPPDAPYLLDIGGLSPDDRDKKLRLRLDGDRLLPYFTRAEIERRAPPGAPVLAWVDSPVALYSMQIQGSGKVRLADGRTVRLAYAEQNGHPFKPAVRLAGTGTARVTTRGLGIELAFDDDARPRADDAPAEQASPVAMRSPATRPTPERSMARPRPLAAEVERMIDQLVGTAGKPAAPPREVRPDSPSTAPRAAASNHSKAAPTPPSETSPQTLANISTDPSFVFFREIPDGPGGPIGALGVPLTAGRSVAVDPRTTPLGFPVFLSTGPAASPTAVKRLMMAQDTGGAIRGAVRADYFWGFGATAFAHAARMNQSGRMWLLMPRGLQIAARDQPSLTRGGLAATALPDCVIADDSSCVEDR